MYFPDRGCVRTLHTLYGYATVHIFGVVGITDYRYSGPCRLRCYISTLCSGDRLTVL